jgi:adenosylhomocysteinase
VKNHASLGPQVYNVPQELDQQVARTKLKVMGIEIDELTKEQRKYLHGWQEGT